jgi:hypothetical protein
VNYTEIPLQGLADKYSFTISRMLASF